MWIIQFKATSIPAGHPQYYVKGHRQGGLTLTHYKHEATEFDDENEAYELASKIYSPSTFKIVPVPL